MLSEKPPQSVQSSSNIHPQPASAKPSAIDRTATAAEEKTITERRSIRSDAQPSGHCRNRLPSWMDAIRMPIVSIESVSWAP